MGPNPDPREPRALWSPVEPREPRALWSPVEPHGRFVPEWFSMCQFDWSFDGSLFLF